MVASCFGPNGDSLDARACSPISVLPRLPNPHVPLTSCDNHLNAASSSASLPMPESGTPSVILYPVTLLSLDPFPLMPSTFSFVLLLLLSIITWLPCYPLAPLLAAHCMFQTFLLVIWCKTFDICFINFSTTRLHTNIFVILPCPVLKTLTYPFWSCGTRPSPTWDTP